MDRHGSASLRSGSPTNSSQSDTLQVNSPLRYVRNDDEVGSKADPPDENGGSAHCLKLLMITYYAAWQFAPSGRCSNHLQRSREMLLPSSLLRSDCDSDRQRLRAVQTHAVPLPRNHRE